MTTPRPLFVYGTLRAPRLLAWALTGDATNTSQVAQLMVPAIVSGFRRCALQHRDYPAVIRDEDPNSTVDGYLLQLETNIQRKKLDNFEGEIYSPTSVAVQLTDQDGQPTGTTIEADMYLWNGPTELLEQEPWDFDTFVQDRLDDWIDLFEGIELISDNES